MSRKSTANISSAGVDDFKERTVFTAAGMTEAKTLSVLKTHFCGQ